MKVSHRSALFVISKGVLAIQYSEAATVTTTCIDGRVKHGTSWGKTISVLVKTYQYTRRKYEKDP